MRAPALRFAFREYPLCAALICFVLGGAVALLGVRLLGSPWGAERVVERIVEKPVEIGVAKPAVREARPGRADLIVMQKNIRGLGDEGFSEYFVEETCKLPGVDRVSEGVVSNANLQREGGEVDELFFLVQGWRPDNFGFEGLEIIEGRVLKEGDTRKVMLGRTLATNLNKKVGDKFTFVADPDHPYEVIAVFKSKVVFEDGGAIVGLKDGQDLTGKRVTGFSVRVKKTSPDFADDVDVVRKQIEALRDPKDPVVRLKTETPE